jgi:acetoin utilization deacetylase AcuC-like enzyme
MERGVLERAVRAGRRGRPAGRRTLLAGHLPPAGPPRDGAAWLQALDVALARVAAFGPQAVLVSLGVDTFEKDPISAFKLRGDDYPQIGRRLAALRLPTGYVFEGGYATAEVGVNAVGVLQGHLAAA